MAQLTVYIDESTLQEIEKTASREKSSVSKWVKKVITNHFQNEWPESFVKTVGSLKESDLTTPSKLSFKNDIKRESL